MHDFKQLAFIGLGVMGEPMCRNLAQKSGIAVTGFDKDPAPLQRLAVHGVGTAASLRDAVAGADVIFLSLPSGEAVAALARGPDGLLAHLRAGQTVVDTSTSDVTMTRTLAREFNAAGVAFVDAPVARTRQAAEAGTLAVMVGAEKKDFDRIRSLIACYATDISLCGGIGCGQVVKILNNMLLFQNVTALAEAKVIGERMGVDAAVLLETLASGSADSFALRNHVMNAVLPDTFPERAFSVSYALKDLNYGLKLAQDAHVETPAAERVKDLFHRSIAAGFGPNYWPVVSRIIREG